LSGPSDGLGAVSGAPRSDTNPHSGRPPPPSTPAQPVFACAGEPAAAGARRVEPGRRRVAI